MTVSQFSFLSRIDSQAFSSTIGGTISEKCALVLMKAKWKCQFQSPSCELPLHPAEDWSEL